MLIAKDNRIQGQRIAIHAARNDQERLKQYIISQGGIFKDIKSIYEFPTALQFGVISGILTSENLVEKIFRGFSSSTKKEVSVFVQK